jgi:leader peptidase (prepilin peptidase)/N-methyltransferase
MYVEVIGYALIFIAGAAIGSFLNVVADRVSHDESPFWGRSRCDHCNTPLAPMDLIPLLSFLMLKGKCRYCGKKLSWYYPFSELLTGLAYLGLAYYIQVFSVPNYLIWVSFGYLAAIASFYIIILLADLKYKLIPNKIIKPAIGFVLAVMVLSFGLISAISYLQLKSDPFGQYLLQVGYWSQQISAMLKGILISVMTAGLIAGFFKVLIWATKGRGMGGGDVKLAFMIGLVNGFPMNIVAVVLGFVTGALFSVILMAMRRKGLKDVIPFGPFLILGSVLAFTFGQQIFNWYMALL